MAEHSGDQPEIETYIDSDGYVVLDISLTRDQARLLGLTDADAENLPPTERTDVSARILQVTTLEVVRQFFADPETSFKTAPAEFSLYYLSMLDYIVKALE